LPPRFPAGRKLQKPHKREGADFQVQRAVYNFKFDFAFVAVSPRNTLNVNQNLTQGKKMKAKETKRELLSVLPTLRCKGIVIVDRPDFFRRANNHKGEIWNIFGEKK